MHPKGQLWRPSVASADDPESWAEERADEGEPKTFEPRQLGGISYKDAVASVSVGSEGAECEALCGFVDFEGLP